MNTPKQLTAHFTDAPDAEIDKIDTVELTPQQKQILNDNILELL